MLTKGMLWVDDTAGRSLDRKVEQAASYYQAKYGSMPNVCYVHPSALADAVPSVRFIKVLEAKHILPHHLWLGIVPAALQDDPSCA